MKSVLLLMMSLYPRVPSWDMGPMEVISYVMNTLASVPARVSTVNPLLPSASAVWHSLSINFPFGSVVVVALLEKKLK